MKALAWTSVMGLLLLLFCVWERVEMVRVGYHIEQLKKQKVQLQRERDELRVKVSSLTAPERIAKAAAEKLGMEAPQQGQVVLVKVEAAGRGRGPRDPMDRRAPMPEIRLASNDVTGKMP
jgi:cell division protein FtsL